ncbi:MAG: glycosyltransferase [Pseudomonadota bacterium]
MRLSIIVVAYDMPRELPRCIQSLAPAYQTNVDPQEYEVLVLDNGSPTAINQDGLAQTDLNLRVVEVPEPSVSPAVAVNLGLQLAVGEYVCIMIDGAHVLTPGVLHWTFSAFRSFSNPVVAVRYFYLGPGDQPQTVLRGYDSALEDELLAEIAWPGDGYRLFEIGAALRGGSGSVSWLNRMFESNCISLRREFALALGGMDERFDTPGGGFVNLDFFKRACDDPHSQLVALIGEGSFHQVHGGTTTNSIESERELKLQQFRRQYRALRGTDDLISATPIHYLGHLPSEDAKIHRRPSGRLSARYRDRLAVDVEI